VRLNKLVAQIIPCSRREADVYIKSGLVEVNGRVVEAMGVQVDPHTSLVNILQQSALSTATKDLPLTHKTTILLNKPLGIVSCQPEDGHTPAVQLLTWANEYKPTHSRRGGAPLQPGPKVEPRRLPKLAVAGRLDINSTGLLVFTQNGALARSILGPTSIVEKEYLVRVIKTDQLMPNWQQVMQKGIVDKGETLRAKSVQTLHEDQLRVVLVEGKHHQLRRMCQRVGWMVKAIKRVRIGKIVLGDLPVGQWRYWTGKDTLQ
jgi:23S rRNA pseudouridine2604 synthase